MGVLTNATTLRKSEKFKDWVQSACMYQARVVMAEASSVPDTFIRKKLAKELMTTPTLLNDLMIAIVATDPAIADTATTVESVSEQTIIDKVAAQWTAVAKFTYYPQNAEGLPV